ncbi:OmpA family protein [Aurantibacter sp.]|uniref:OmpA family protein n=1 Tax=Aurantibacter sp. TaxID=2807103 RepID=UPI0035C86883
MKYLLVIILLFINLVSAQNLVKNGSFESSKKGPWTYGDFHNNVLFWNSPSLGTPDLFSSDSKKMNTVNYRGKQKPKNGSMYAGIYTYTIKDNSDYREYIQNELKQTLKEKHIYKISFYLSLAETSTHISKDIQLVFSNKKVGNTVKASAIFTQPTTPKKMTHGCINLKDEEETQTILIPFFEQTLLSYDWIKVELEYEALGFESFFTIGNFKTNVNTTIKPLKTVDVNPFTYFYLDDFSITEIGVVPENIFQPEKTYTFSNVLFDFDKAILLDSSIEELDKLAFHLKTNNNLNIEIYGHTDNDGLETRNKQLSLQRAKAVSDYLIYKGLDKTRIKWFGFGAEQPVVENNTEENKAINRRVNFKLINN